MPTLISVFFAQLLVLVSNDVQRTESFARLARSSTLNPNFVIVEQALNYIPKVWWKTFFVGLQKKKNGGRRNMVLTLSVLTTGLGLLLIPTFLSSLLLSEQVVISTPVELKRTALDSDGTLLLNARRDTYFLTTSSFPHNAPTTMLATDDHVIFPFQFSDGKDSNESVLMVIWVTETTVYQLKSECVKMTIETPDTKTLTYEYGWGDRTYTFFSARPDNVSHTINHTVNIELQRLVLVADVGCSIEMMDAITAARSMSHGGLIWTNLSHERKAPIPTLATMGGHHFATIHSSSSAEIVLDVIYFLYRHYGGLIQPTRITSGTQTSRRETSFVRQCIKKRQCQSL